jgi:hypothetical protein
VIDWSKVTDSRGTAEQVPILLARVEREQDPESWDELWDRLCLLGETVFPASLAALPHLVALATSNTRALELAGAIVRAAQQQGTGDALPADYTNSVAQLQTLIDAYLRSRPDDYHRAFRDLLATQGQHLWSAAIGDFEDDFYHLPCPQCGIEVTIAIGGHGRYSAIRDWHAGDIDRHDLTPSLPASLVGAGKEMHQIAQRDGQHRLAEGITHLFGHAECPRCAAMFPIAEAYAAAANGAPGLRSDTAVVQVPQAASETGLQRQPRVGRVGG